MLSHRVKNGQNEYLSLSFMLLVLLGLSTVLKVNFILNQGVGGTVV